MLIDALKLISETTEHLSNTIDVFKDFLKEDKENKFSQLAKREQKFIEGIKNLLN